MAAQLHARIRLENIRAVAAPTLDSGGFLLFVAGQDGKFNVGSTGAIQYLFTGTSGRCLTNGGRFDDVTASYEDTLVLVTKNSVEVYYPEAARGLEGTLSAWADAKEFKLRDADCGDVERAEHYKVRGAARRCRQSSYGMWRLRRTFACCDAVLCAIPSTSCLASAPRHCSGAVALCFANCVNVYQRS